MTRYGILVNIDKCNGCYNCYMACRDEFTGNDYPGYSVALPEDSKAFMKVVEKERGTVPKVKVDYIAIPCMQCSDAPCVNKSQNGAVYRRDDGIVIIDPEKAKGDKDIVNNCPHRLITWNEEKQVAQKCTFCAQALDKGWKEPRCVEACPAGALVFGNLNDPDSEISKLISSSKTEELNPKFRLRPNVRYIDLPKRFIAGEVVLGDKQGDCAPGVTVELSDGSSKMKLETDSFGDFEFDGLESSKKYTITVAHKGYDLNIGVIELEPEKKAMAKKTTAAKSAKKTAVAKKTTAKKPAVKATAKKAVAKKATAKKAAAKKPTAKSSKKMAVAKKAAPKKTATKNTAAKKTSAKPAKKAKKK